jgi:putative ATPase
MAQQLFITSRPPPPAPLADRMRPRTLEEYVGQTHLLGPGGPLRLALESRRAPACILWGPPGTGKTTLARLLALATATEFVPFSAVLGGVKELRQIIDEAADRRTRTGRGTTLFVDEIHRFNKSQQDAFLPHVESGLITLLGATTENPSFELNAALLSRVEVFVLHALTDDELVALLNRALADPERGLGRETLPLEPGVLEALAAQADGDARRALNLLEQLAETWKSDRRRPDRIDLEYVRRGLSAKSLRYDRASEEHYNIASALIKSLRGSDPDASIYWLARMIEGGEDPTFIARRLVIFASEDVGNADPRGLQIAVAAAQAVELIGLPEALYNLSQATLYLATAPKSNSAKDAYYAALEDVRSAGSLPVPLHLRNAPTRLMKAQGYGEGYLYPHAYPGHYVEQQYLPDRLRHRRYFKSSGIGYEKTIGERLEHMRRIARGEPPGGQTAASPDADRAGGRVPLGLPGRERPASGEEMASPAADRPATREDAATGPDCSSTHEDAAPGPDRSPAREDAEPGPDSSSTGPAE